MVSPLVSIVMTYFNRKDQLAFTLQTINKSSIRDKIEVIIVDDGSAKDHLLTLKDLNFSFPIEVHRIEETDKSWINPVIPFNLGISKARGEWIVLQNPEVCHVGDVCAYVARADKSVYHVMQVWAADEGFKPSTYRSLALGPNPFSKIFYACRKGRKVGWSGVWYSTPKQPQRAYHFCSALHRSVMDKLGGFHPGMAQGVWYDDDELLARIRKVVRQVLFVPSGVMGIHQWHPAFQNSLAKKIPKRVQEKLKLSNLAILRKTQKEPSIVYMNPEEGLPTTYKTLVNEAWEVTHCDKPKPTAPSATTLFSAINKWKASP